MSTVFADRITAVRLGRSTHDLWEDPTEKIQETYGKILKKKGANANHLCMDCLYACNLHRWHPGMLPFGRLVNPKSEQMIDKHNLYTRLYTSSTREILLRLLEHSITKTDFQQLQNHCCNIGKPILQQIWWCWAQHEAQTSSHALNWAETSH